MKRDAMCAHDAFAGAVTLHDSSRSLLESGWGAKVLPWLHSTSCLWMLA